MLFLFFVAILPIVIATANSEVLIQVGGPWFYLGVCFTIPLVSALLTSITKTRDSYYLSIGIPTAIWSVLVLYFSENTQIYAHEPKHWFLFMAIFGLFFAPFSFMFWLIRGFRKNKKKIFLKRLPILAIYVVVFGIVAIKINNYSQILSDELYALAKSGLPPLARGGQRISPTKEPGEAFLEGKVELLDKDLDLFHPINDPSNFAAKRETRYYSAGKYTKGMWKGYTRILVDHPEENFQGYELYVLATKDFKSYYLEGDPATENENSQRNRYIFSSIKRSKILGLRRLPISHPETLKLDSNFLLHRKTNDFKIIDQADLESKVLSRSNDHRHTYFQVDEEIKDYDSNVKLELIKIEANQFTSKTRSSVYVQDSTGLIYPYDEVYEVAYKYYLSELGKPGGDQYSLRNLSSLSISSAEIEGAHESLYPYYSAYSPIACSSDVSTMIIKNIDEDDLRQVGVYFGLNVYALKNSDHILNRLSYYNKTKISEEYFRYYNQSSYPTYTQYLKNVPVLLMKDYWGRWYALGEYTYKLEDGCGKPVIYLYPEKTTNVRIYFTQPMLLKTSIPTYESGWHVRAQPDGKLTDLQPEKTNCSLINSQQFGSEYAQVACQKNSYPYIYWAGHSFSGNYIRPSSGWVISDRDLDTFLKEKLIEIGLNSQERGDMLEYWIPELKRAKSPFYRISFLQTEQMNFIAPLSISPYPDTLFRVFLDWVPLVSIPEEMPIPQKLHRLERQGFTVVEWGGLKQ